MRFIKMEGAGNDYVYLDLFHQPAPKDPSALAIEISRYHFGVGSDGLILIAPDPNADARMIMFNADGSESAMCGNGIRCVAAYYYAHIEKKNPVVIQTGSGIKTITVNLENGVPVSYTVDMGEPLLSAEAIPVLSDTPQNLLLPMGDAEALFTCVNVGNPHAVTVTEKDPLSLPIEVWGPKLEHDPHFPEFCNIEWIRIRSKQEIDMRVWERGSGETLACGTGTCASVVAAILRGLCGREVLVHVRGGELKILWDSNNNHVYMTGPARIVFTGEYPDA